MIYLQHVYNVLLSFDCLFYVGPYECSGLQYYSLDAPGPRDNAYRLLRGMQVGKPLLIEGPPGVGKTSLVTALASYSGHHLARINLSEHTVSFMNSRKRCILVPRYL